MIAKVVFSAILYTALAVKPFYDVTDDRLVSEMFERFATEYNRTYGRYEISVRFNYFVEHLKLINKLNAEDEATHAINHFADMSKEEKLRYHGRASFKQLLKDTKQSPIGDCTLQSEPRTKDAPIAWDWRLKQAVTPVKAQLDCGSCWAVATIALVESRYLMQGKKLSLSVQQLLDCTSNSSCSGGFPSLALTKIMEQGGLESETDYPYEVKKRECRFDNKKIAAGVKTCTTYILKDEEALKELLFKEGPLIVAVASGPWETYKSGILSKRCDDQQIDHVAQLVGYGTEGEVDYWIIKNTWGGDWGENGFIRMKRGVDCCSILPRDDYSVLSATV